MSFPKPPRSELFAKLEAFLPQIATENQKLEQDIAQGNVAKHSIEVEDEEHEEEAAAAGDDQPQTMDHSEGHDVNGHPSTKKQMIEMNFALGLLDDGVDSDSESSGRKNHQDHAITLPSAHSSSSTGQEPTAKLVIPSTSTSSSKATSATAPLIQEL